MASAFNSEDVTATMGALFDINAKLAEIAEELRSIRALLEGDDEEEED